MEWCDDAVAVVTGAGSGIGLAIARRFATAGMRLMLADVHAESLDAAVGELRGAGAAVTSRITDVSKFDDVAALAEATVAEYGEVNIVCNNAGVSGGGMTWELSDDDWRWVLDVNMWGVINGIRAFVPRILEAGRGHVVNTASMAGLVAAPGMGPYNASKHAVVGISETLFHELSMTSPEVSASVLCPGWVRTNILNAAERRPETYGGPVDLAAATDPASAMMRDVVSGLIENGLEPSAVADRVYNAIAARKFWIFTHDGWLDAARNRYDRAFGGENPTLSLPGVMD